MPPSRRSRPTRRHRPRDRRRSSPRYAAASWRRTARPSPLRAGVPTTSLAGDPHLVAERVPVADKPLTAAQRARLGIGPDEPVRYRRVRLACGDRVLSEADNWYVPARLTPEMNATLDTTRTPSAGSCAPRPGAQHRRGTRAGAGAPRSDRTIRSSRSTPCCRPGPGSRSARSSRRIWAVRCRRHRGRTRPRSRLGGTGMGSRFRRTVLALLATRRGVRAGPGGRSGRRVADGNRQLEGPHRALRRRLLRHDHQRAREGARREEPGSGPARPQRRRRPDPRRATARRRRLLGVSYNPNDGKTYSGSLKLTGPDSLEVSGCVMSVFCKRQTWTRVK